MIENPHPTDWRALQDGVCRLFKAIGLTAETEKLLKTPRGSTKVDVFAVDENSVDRVRYVVECKSWSSATSQSVVHGFTTVMHQTGGNIGFIVSRVGFQSGARDYLHNTNIVGLTYEDLQRQYFHQWRMRWFGPTVL